MKRATESSKIQVAQPLWRSGAALGVSTTLPGRLVGQVSEQLEALRKGQNSLNFAGSVLQKPQHRGEMGYNSLLCLPPTHCPS